MSKIGYIDYNGLNEFYSIKELCKLFSMSKDELKKYCEKYDIKPRRNEIGEHGFVKYDVRKLHNAIWHEQAEEKDDDPWA